MLGFLCRNFRHCPKELKETLYFSFVRSVLEYACIVWDPQTKSLSDKLERVQSRCARYVLNNYTFKASVTAMKEQLHWQLLSRRRKNLRLKLFYCLYNDKTCITKENYIRSPFYMSEKVDHQYKDATINSCCRSFFIRTALEWNMLSEIVFPSVFSPETFLENLSLQ